MKNNNVFANTADMQSNIIADGDLDRPYENKINSQ